MEWLEESERALDSELEIANDPDKIKTQLTQHKVTDTSPLPSVYFLHFPSYLLTLYITFMGANIK